MLVPINITGQTYEARSKAISSQLTQNFYPEKLDNTSVKSPYVLHRWFGMKSFGNPTGNTSPDRGMFEHNDVVYKVTGAKMYSVAANGAHVELGNIPGTGRCILEGINSNVVLTTQGKAYQYNGSTVAEITDADLETPNSCAHLNNQMLYDGDGGRFASSAVGDATAINGLDYATAESAADELKRVYTFDQLAYMMGAKTIEPWWNDGTGRPPFSPVEGGIMSIGLAAINSVSNNDRAMYFLGDDNHVYRIVKTSFEPVSNIWLHRTISEFSNISDAVGFCFTAEGQNFYCLTFPGENKSFVFSETGGWFNISSGTSGGRSYANSYVFAHRKHLIADHRNGNIYEWDLDTYLDNNEPIVCIRETGVLHGGLFGKPGKTITMNSFELIMETGVGLISGQGQDPKIMLSFSDDGGKTFGTEIWGSIGKSGEFQKKVEWFGLGSFRDRIIRVKLTDPVFCSIHSASADLEVGI